MLILGLKAKLLSLGLECSGLSIKYKAIHYCLTYGTTDHTTVFLLNNYHRRHYYFIVVFLENSENDSKLTDINCGIFRQFTFAFLALTLVLHVSGLGLDTSGLVNIPGFTTRLVISGWNVFVSVVSSDAFMFR